METNLNDIRETAKIFLHLPIHKDKHFSPLLCVHHPFLSSSIVSLPSKKLEWVDLLESPEGLKEYYNVMEDEIDNGDLYKIYALIRKPYRLTFIKHCEPYLSEKDLAELFADAWVSSENPNQDAKCSISYLIKMFQKCDKKYLMQEEDYKVYESLPDVFNIYRGVAVGRNPQGLSWTQNLETAKWFANRFNTDTKKGYVQVGIAKKEHVLAYFNTRGEDEIVYNSKKLDISIFKEV